MASLDMALDDVIKKNRRNNEKGGRGQGGPRGRGHIGPSRGGRPFGRFGAPRRNPLGVNTQPSSFAIAKYIRRSRPLPWQSDLFEDSLKAAGLSSMDSGTKIYISNLDSGVSNEDIRELFSEFGELIRYAIHFDKNARPSGTAEVVFARSTDAFQAFKRYNNVQLDGRSMKMEIIGANAPISPRVNVGAANGKKRAVVMGRGLGGRSTGDFAATNRYSVQRSQGGPSNFRGGRGGGGRGGSRLGRGGARRANRSVKKSADELDKELESYHADAMQS